MKFTCALLIIGILNLVCVSQTNETQVAESTIRIQQEVNKLGINHKVGVKLLNGKKITGFIKEINATGFILVDGYKIVDNRAIAIDRTNSAKEIQFSEVKTISNKGIGLPGKVLIVTLGVAFGVAALYGFVFLLGGRPN